ncbi:MAG: mannosyl-3-phosphoglycerate phosphatase [Halioglobus sp.]
MRVDKAAGLLVFTDLDGSLLDHHSYSYEAAEPQLRRLEQLGVPVIPVSSKTRPEIEALRRQLGNAEPFIAENGAAAFIPQGYFVQQPAETALRDGYWVREWAAPRDVWLGVLASLDNEFAGEYETFSAVGVEGVMALTGLDRAAAELANQRDYTEQVRWLGDKARKAQFVEALQGNGASVTQGGRFLSVSGNCSKGDALCWLRGLYKAAWPECTVCDLAIGDSANDIDMLEAAHTCLLIRSPAHELPRLQRQDGFMLSTVPGPTGWAEGVERWLQLHQDKIT